MPSPKLDDARLDDATSLAWLRLLIEWGADEALGETPVDRRLTPAPARPPVEASGRIAADFPEATPAPAATTPTSAPALGALARQAEARAASCEDLDALQRAMDGFDDFVLRQTATNTVRVALGARPRLIVVGETADENEDRSGQPFAGRIGAGLDRMLAAIGLSRDDCALLPAIAWRPPGGRPAATAECAACAPFLRRRLALTAAAIAAARVAEDSAVPVLLLGKLPLRLLLGEAEATASLRGAARGASRQRRIDLDGGLALDATVLSHPTMLAAQPALRRPTWHGLLALRERLSIASDGSITDL